MNYKEYCRSIISERETDIEYYKISKQLTEALVSEFEEVYTNLFNGFKEKLEQSENFIHYWNFDSTTDKNKEWDNADKFVETKEFQQSPQYKSLFNFKIYDANYRKINVSFKKLGKVNASYIFNSDSSVINSSEYIHQIIINSNLKINNYFTVDYIIHYTLRLIQFIIFEYNNGNKELSEELNTLKEGIDDLLNWIKSDEFKITFEHEIRHFYDNIKYGKESMIVKIKNSEEIFNKNFKRLSGGVDIDDYTKDYLKYFSNNTEQNAHYMLIANEMMRWLLNLPEHKIEFTQTNELFKKFEDEVLKKRKDIQDKFLVFDLINEKQRMLKRLYNLINVYKKGL